MQIFVHLCIRDEEHLFRKDDLSQNPIVYRNEIPKDYLINTIKSPTRLIY